ncbi:hypothetical protein NMY22_g19128 [Coprinellus aureogranulatus]|nr:hypothetical protein NMY22_g19128 [Coprinellus aureogranulatus]
MVLQSLPKELTDLILDEVARMPRQECLPALIACSTVHRSFVGTCQKYIFQTVTLTCPPETYSPLDSHYEVYEASVLWAESVASRPELGASIRHLTLQIDDRNISGPNKDLVLDAIGQLSGVESLCLEGILALLRGEEGRFPIPVTMDPETISTIATLFQQSKIRRLRAEGINDFPSEIFTNGLCVEELLLHSSSLRPAVSLHRNDDLLGPIPSASLTNLVSDAKSLRNWVHFFLIEEGTNHEIPSRFSRLTHVDVIIDNESIPVLAQAQCLMFLRVQRDIEAHLFYHYDPTVTPLQSLHSRSFSTLSSLTYAVNTHISTPARLPVDPYHSFFDTPLLSRPYPFARTGIKATFSAGGIPADSVASHRPNAMEPTMRRFDAFRPPAQLEDRQGFDRHPEPLGATNSLSQ